jgi:hypothetical protein
MALIVAVEPLMACDCYTTRINLRNYPLLKRHLYALIAKHRTTVLCPPPEGVHGDAIDPFWHGHILHTKEYMSFGERVFGQYVPHEPLNHEDPVRVAHVASLYSYTSGVYRRLFNYVNPAFYPDVMPEARLLCAHAEIFAQEVRIHDLDVERLPVAM